MRPPIGRVCLGVVAATLAAVTLTTAPHTDAAARNKPDLIVAAGRLTLRGGVVWTTRLSVRVFTWRHRTQNIGTAPSPKTRTQVEFVLGPNQSQIGARLRVPRLEPDGSHEGRGSFDVDFRDFDYGTYPTRICADGSDVVAERKEGNNCKRLGPIYVVPYDLRGRVAGVFTQRPGGGIVQTLSWEGTVGFELASPRSADAGIFDYRYFEGTLLFTYQQTDSMTGCSANGTGRYTPAEMDGVRLFFGADPRYRSLRGVVGSAFHFPVTVMCPGAPPLPIEFYPDGRGVVPWFDTGPRAMGFPDPGLDRLRDTYTSPSPASIQYNWNLEATG